MLFTSMDWNHTIILCNIGTFMCIFNTVYKFFQQMNIREPLLYMWIKSGVFLKSYNIFMEFYHLWVRILSSRRDPKQYGLKNKGKRPEVILTPLYISKKLVLEWPKSNILLKHYFLGCLLNLQQNLRWYC